MEALASKKTYEPITTPPPLVWEAPQLTGAGETWLRQLILDRFEVASWGTVLLDPTLEKKGSDIWKVGGDWMSVGDIHTAALLQAPAGSLASKLDAKKFYLAVRKLCPGITKRYLSNRFIVSAAERSAGMHSGAVYGWRLRL